MNKVDEKNVDNLSRVAVELIKTREFREVIGGLVPEIVNIWADGNFFKKLMAGPVGKSVKKGFAGEKALGASNHLSDIFQDHEFRTSLCELIPEILNGLLDSVHSFLVNIENLSPEEKAAYLDKMIQTGSGKTGAIITGLSKIIDDIHRHDPTFFADRIGPGFRQWWDAVDFGEVHDLVENSMPDIEAVVKNIFEVIWEQPQKFILIITLFPNLINTLVLFVNEAMSLLNETPPDLLTDVLLATTKQIDGKNIGILINSAAEVIRKIHTGSALIGEPGSPMFSVVLSHIVGEVVDQVDGELLGKAQDIAGAGRDTVRTIKNDLLRRKPELLIRRLYGLGTYGNDGVKAIINKFDLLEDLPRDKIAEALARGMADLNAGDMAEVVNRLTMHANMIYKNDPKWVVSLFDEFANMVDYDELEEFLSWAVDDFFRASRPVARMVTPKLVMGFCEWFAEEDDGNQEDMDEARGMLRNLFLGKGGQA